ncbi:hypothetical protein LEP1GSC047_3961 [Leptospira inadai serovar Lyme str. 10]|uniref:Uncharacterized protein n=1 Tax=Leptospira inadai serovar Lyme str. 10 TaxID=1049790 RepID=V6HEL8_9LEPT|nr:hypothetical protein LEP1GSC047_3961 [Leptospira inadai serovar Lyme str. 10]
MKTKLIKKNIGKLHESIRICARFRSENPKLTAIFFEIILDPPIIGPRLGKLDEILIKITQNHELNILDVSFLL